MTELNDRPTQLDPTPLENPDKTNPVVCGTSKAKLFAFGLTPTGYISVGVVPMGVLAIGIVPMGVISFGVVAMGTVAAGFVSMGVAAFGGQTMGLVNLGRDSVGGIEIRTAPHHALPEVPSVAQPTMQNSSNPGNEHHHH
jgi:hypothetical protein